MANNKSAYYLVRRLNHFVVYERLLLLLWFYFIWFICRTSFFFSLFCWFANLLESSFELNDCVFMIVERNKVIVGNKPSAGFMIAESDLSYTLCARQNQQEKLTVIFTIINWPTQWEIWWAKWKTNKKNK